VSWMAVAMKGRRSCGRRPISFDDVTDSGAFVAAGPRWNKWLASNVGWSWSASRGAQTFETRRDKHLDQECQMDITTLLIIVLLVVLLGGGGWYGRGRWFGR
jgi:hypothetical protein